MGQILYYEGFDANWTFNSSVQSPAPIIRFWTSEYDQNSEYTWHRNDYTTNWINPNQGSPSETGFNGSPYYARLHTSSSSISSMYTPVFNFSAYINEEVRCRFYVINPDGTEELYYEIKNQDNNDIRSRLLHFPSGFNWGSYDEQISNRFLNSNMRFRFGSYLGIDPRDFDLGLDNFVIYIPPKITSNEIMPVCTSQSTNLTVTDFGSQATYVWEPTPGLVSTNGRIATVAPTQTTTYKVNVMVDGMIFPASYTVSVSHNPNMLTESFPIGSDACNQDYVKLSASLPESNVVYEELFPSETPWRYIFPFYSVSLEHSNTNYAGGSSPELSFINLINGSWGFIYKVIIFPQEDQSNVIKRHSLHDFASANLEFRFAFDAKDQNNYNRKLSVEASIDNINYNEIWSINNIQNDIGSTFVSINLNNYLNSYVYIRFVYSGQEDGFNAWYMDDVKIIGTPPNYSFSPTTNLYTNPELTIPYTGEIATTVYAEPNGTQSYTLNSTVNGCVRTDTKAVTNHISRFHSNIGYWDNANNWRPVGVPNASKCVRVPNGRYLEINVDNAEAKSIRNEATGSVSILNGSSLRVIDEIKNLGTPDRFVVESGANLLQENPWIQNEGEITVKRNILFSDERKQYNFVSSPTIGQNLKTIYPGNNPVLKYNESNNYFNSYNGNYQTALGVAIKEPTKLSVAKPQYEAEFIGTPFNGPTTITLKYTDPGDQNIETGYNLVGNPYPSNINLKDVYYLNSDYIEPNFWFWDNRGNQQFTQMGSNYNGNHYACLNIINGTSISASVPSSYEKRFPTLEFPVAGGFIVRAFENANGKDLVFANEMRINEHGVNFFGKNNLDEESKDRYWLSLLTPDDLQVMTAVVYFNEGNDEFSLDDTKTSESSDDLYTMVDFYQLKIQGKSPFHISDEIKLGLRTFKEGHYILSIFKKEGIFQSNSRLSAIQPIYLVDHELNVITDISKIEYRFWSEKGEFNDRFSIRYQNSLSPLAQNKLNITKFKDKILVQSTEEQIAEIDVFNISNKKLYSIQNLNELVHEIPKSIFKSEILIFKIKTVKGVTYNQKFINY